MSFVLIIVYINGILSVLYVFINTGGLQSFHLSWTPAPSGVRTLLIGCWQVESLRSVAQQSAEIQKIFTFLYFAQLLHKTGNSC